MDGFGFAFEIAEDYRDVAAKFPDDLAAGAAGGRERVGVGRNGDGVEAAFAFADGFEDGDALGANGETVGGVFDVATAEDAARVGADSGADTEIGKWRVSVFASKFG